MQNEELLHSAFYLLPSPLVVPERSTAVHRDPANVGRRFIPLLLGDCALPDTLRRCKAVDFREESEAAFAEVPATGQAEIGAVLKPRFDPPTRSPKGKHAEIEFDNITGS